MPDLRSESTGKQVFTSEVALDSLSLTVYDAAGTALVTDENIPLTEGLSGSYTLASETLAAGRVKLVWTAVADSQTTHYENFTAVTPAVLGGLCTLKQVKDRGQKTNNSNDTLIQQLIDVLPRRLFAQYGREFVSTGSATRIFPVTSREVGLKSYDLRSCSAVVLNPEDSAPITLTPNADYALHPIGADELTGTYASIRLADPLNLVSDYSRQFGHALLVVTGAWGIFTSAADVEPDINEACIETVLSWLSKPVADISAIDSNNPTLRVPSTPNTWDIPASAHRKFAPYSRNSGVY